MAADAPVTPQRLAGGEPTHAYRTLAPGLLARTAFAAPAEKGARFAVEVWDVMVGPGKTSEKARLPGAAVIEVRSGTGVLRVGDQPRELRTGATATLDEGADFTVTNSDREAPLILRATVIRVVRP